jgi:hypothetical protein
MTGYDPRVRTRTLARVVGPYMLVLGATLLSRQALFADLLPTFMANPPLVLATGAFTLIAGLCIVASHHHWSGAAASVVSIIGIMVSFKGAWLMVAPEWGAEATELIVTAPGALLVAAALEFAVGVWLTFVGWLARPSN